MSQVENDPRTRWVSQGATDHGAIAWCCERCGDCIELSAMISPPGRGGCECYGEQSVTAARAASQSKPQAQAKTASQPENLLPGWTCVKCLAFNGSAKEELKACRACGTPRPSIPGPHSSAENEETIRELHGELASAMKHGRSFMMIDRLLAEYMSAMQDCAQLLDGCLPGERLTVSVPREVACLVAVPAAEVTKSFPKQPDLKIGDRVHQDYGRRGVSGTVERWTAGELWVRWDDEGSFSRIADLDVRLVVETEPLPKFEVGDRVRRKTAPVCAYSPEYELERVWTVDEVTPTHVRVHDEKESARLWVQMVRKVSS